MKRLRTLFPIFCLAIVVAGAAGIHTASENPNPTAISLDTASQVDSFTWVRLQGASAHLLGAVLRTSSGGTLKSAYLPLYASDEPGGPIVALLETDDEEILAVLAEMRPLADDLAALAGFYKENRERLVLARDFEGMAKPLSSISAKDRSRLRSAEDDLDEDALIIDDGARPDMTASVTCTLLGAVGLFFWLRSRRKRRSAQAWVATPSTQPTA